MKFYRILTLTFFAYTLISCGGAEERKSVYMEKAKTSIESGDFDKARIELKNVLQIDPKDGEAYYQLGSVYEKQKKYRKAYGNYLKAEELDSGLLSNHAKLGRIYLLLMNDSAKAQEKIDLILSKEPDNADGLLLKAVLALKNGKLKESIAMTENIVASNLKHLEGIAFLATLYMENGNIIGAIEALDAGIENNQNNEQLSKLLALALVKNKEFKRAEEIYVKFLENKPESSAGYNNLAAFYVHTDNQIKAKETLRASIVNDPKDVNRILSLIKYIKTTESDAEAIKELKSFLEKNNGLGKLYIALGELLLTSGNKQEAINVYKQAAINFSEEETGVTSLILLASIYIGENDFDKANQLIEEVVLVSPNDPKVNMLRAKLAVRDKNMDKAIISLRVVTKEMPENIEAHVLLAEIYRSEKNNEQAVSVLNSAYSKNKNNADALLQLAQYYFSRDIQKAEKVIGSYINIKPSNYEGLSIKAAIFNQSKRQDEAKKIAEVLMDSYPKKPNGYLLAVPYYMQKEDKKKAESVLEEGYLNSKDNRKLLVLLTSLQVVDKKFDVAGNRIKAELAVMPGDVALKTLLAKVHVANENKESAIKLLNEVVVSRASVEEPYLLLAQLYQSKQDINSFKAVLIKGKKSVKSSIKIPLKLAAAYELEGEYQEAVNTYRDLYKLKPNNLLVINNLVSLLSDHGSGVKDLEFAKTLLPKLEESTQPVFLDTVGWMYYKLGDSEKSVQYLTQAIEKMPDVKVFNYHLGMSYILSNDKKQAKDFLEKSIEGKESFKERAAAENALKKL